jgi:DNA-binding NtrC family response regulator
VVQQEWWEQTGQNRMNNKKILIVDEDRFAKVCNALLQLDGYLSDHIVLRQQLQRLETMKNFDLVITSYPYGTEVLNKLKNRDIPVVVLSDGVDSDLLACLKQIKMSFCMIKPIDFAKFSKIIENIMTKKMETGFGYEIL